MYASSAARQLGTSLEKDAPLFPAKGGGPLTKADWAAAIGATVATYETEAERETRGTRRIKG